MGVVHGRDLLSSKWPTAIIIDSVGAAHFFPIKNPIGDFFFAIVNNELYCFNTRTQPFSWRQTMAKTFAFYIYFTDNYSPVTSELKGLENIITKNELPRLNILFYKAMKHLAKKEKRKFEALEKKALIESLSKHRDATKERFAEYQSVIEYLDELPFEKIVTPVKRVTEWIDQTILSPDPAIMGAIKTSLELALNQNKEINHVEIKAKKGWMKIILLMCVIGMGIAIGWFVYDGGYLDDLGSMTGASFGAISDTELQARFPNCNSLVDAVNAGSVKLDQISKTGVSIYENCPRAVSP